MLFSDQRLLIFPLLLIYIVLCAQETETSPFIHGIYGSPTPFWNQGYALNELGVNAIFVRSSSINQKMISKAREEGLKIYVEFPVLKWKGYVEVLPEAWAIDPKWAKVESVGGAGLLLSNRVDKYFFE